MTDKPKLLNEGKTKQIWTVPEIVRVKSKDDITAGDGAKHDVFEGKAKYSTETTCNVFELLKRHRLPLAYIARYSETEFLAYKSDMLPLEVVVRRIALGSYLKRNPSVKQGTVFDKPIVEYYLKTSGRKFNGADLPKDDPLITEFLCGHVRVHDPSIPVTGPGILVCAGWDPERLLEITSQTEEIALEAFGILEKAWRRLRFKLADIKFEFGVDENGIIGLADVVDNDSWRLLTMDDVHLDKQRYRDGATLETVRSLYGEVAERSKMLLQY